MKPLFHSPTAPKHSYSKFELEQCADGRLFGVGNAQLPTSPLLMLDRIVDIQATGGEYGRGYAIAALDIDPSEWYFKSHFKGDPVMPGCLLVESLWQLTGFHLAWLGYKGKGRVLESGKTRFSEPVTDITKTLVLSIHVRKLLMSENPICIANGDIYFDELLMCRSDAIKVGLFE